MFAGIASATSLPALSLIAFATSSQACCLREEITTLAPCSAIRSAMARPMPREEPVMTATFPDRSNKVMFPSQTLLRQRHYLYSLCTVIPGRARARTRNDSSGQLALRGNDLRPRRLMHGGVPWVRDPWLLIHERKPPDRTVRACEMIEPRHRY